jgi:hypothetical protein
MGCKKAKSMYLRGDVSAREKGCQAIGKKYKELSLLL